MTFQWPWLLLSLSLIPVLMAVYVYMQWRRRQYAVRFTNLALLGQVVGKGPGLRRHIPPVLFLLGIANLLISLARPEAIVRIPRETTSIMIVMDVSGSMMADDLRPTRMDAAKQAARSLVEALPENMLVGVASFNIAASLNAPLTRDHAVVKRAIDSLYANGGTAIGEGLAVALDQLATRPLDDQGQPGPAIIVLLSDGASQAGRPPAQVAERARSEGIKVYTVGVGQRGAAPQLRTGQRVELDERTLEAIAQATDGQYFYAAQTSELKKIYSDLASRVSWIEEKTEVTAFFSAAGAVFLIIGAILSLFWFARML